MTTLARTHVAARRSVPPFDFILVIATLLVSAVGVVMVYTATRGPLLAAGRRPQDLPEEAGPLRRARRASPWWWSPLIDYRRLEPLANILYWLIVLALLGVFVVGQQRPGRGALVQPRARCSSSPPSSPCWRSSWPWRPTAPRRDEEGLAWRDVFRLLIMAGIPIVLVLLQPDLGTAMIMVIVLLVMLAVAGLPIRILVMLLVGTVAGRLRRGRGRPAAPLPDRPAHHLLEPELAQHQPLRASQAIYNLQQAKNAIGSGGLFGSGIGHGAQTNLGYVPEQQTDFIFTAVGEQLGFVGSVGVLALLGRDRLAGAARRRVARDIFGRLICAGLFAFIAFSVFQNAGMTMGIMPITGIPLPFVSYGGTAVLVFFGAVGLALSVGARRRFR